MNTGTRINVYLKDDLKAALEDFAQEQGFSKSGAIAQILTDRLQGTQPTPNQATLQSLVETAVDNYLSQKFAPTP